MVLSTGGRVAKDFPLLKHMQTTWNNSWAQNKFIRENLWVSIKDKSLEHIPLGVPICLLGNLVSNR